MFRKQKNRTLPPPFIYTSINVFPKLAKIVFIFARFNNFTISIIMRYYSGNSDKAIANVDSVTITITITNNLFRHMVQ